MKQLSVKTSSAKRSSVSVEASLTVRWSKKYLRAAASKYQKSLVSRDILDLLIFCLNDPFGELFLKITLESSADF